MRFQWNDGGLATLLRVGCVILFLIVGFGGCGKDNPTSPPPSNQTDLKDFINSISPFPPPPAEFDQQIGLTTDTTITSGSGISVCTVEGFEMGRNMDEVVAFNPNAATLWPGSIVQGKDVPKGILTAVSAARAPVTVGIPDLPGLSGDQNSRTIENPTLLKVTGALNEIVDNFLATHGPTAPVFAFNMKDTYDFEQGLLDVGVSAGWAGGNLRGQFGYSWTSTKHTVTLRFTQKYYTATLDPPASSAAFFAASVKPADISNYTGTGNPLCYVSSVTYGRIGILEITSSVDQESLKVAVNTAFKKIGDGLNVDVNTSYGKIMKESEMKMLILGGRNTSGVVSVTDPIQGLKDWIDQGMELNDDTRGVPIAYSVCHLKDNSMARFQYTHEFTRRACVWAPQPVYVSVYKILCVNEGTENELEGWMDIDLTTEIPDRKPETKQAPRFRFSDFDRGEERTILDAAWTIAMTNQSGSQFKLHVDITEDDWPTAEDDMGSHVWTWSYPGFNQVTADSCSADGKRCYFSQLFESGSQQIRAFFKVNLDGRP